MPYIIQKRSDIPDGLIQTLNLHPGTSQRRFPYAPVSQTGYRGSPPTATPELTAFVTDAEYAGLAAYFLSSVSDASGDQATAAITTVAVADLVDGDEFTVSDGQNTVTFEFNVTGTHGVEAANTGIDVSGDVSAADVRDSIITAIDASVLDVLAGNGGAATVDLTNENQNQTSAEQNNTDNDEAVADIGFAITDFSGATDSASLTATEAVTNASDVLDEFSYGDTDTDATALDQAALNAAITTGALNQDQVAEILDILTGRNYVLPTSSTVEAGGEFIPGTGDFDDTSIPYRRLYDSGSFRISFNEGRLALMSGDTFTYAGTTGAAVAVYNNDGTLYTGL